MRGLHEICAVLRRWPRNVLPDYRTLATECVEQARALFGAERAILAYSDGDEPWLTVAQADDAGTRCHEDEEGEYALVHPALASATFYYEPGRSVLLGPHGAPSDIADPIGPGIQGACGDGGILSIPIDTEESQGRLFVCSPDADVGAMLLTADIVAALISMRFEATGHTEQAVRDAVAEDRIRVARDLHDGLLQSFTGVVLQLETIHSTLESNPDEAQRMITETQAILMSDQRELRRFVEQLRPRPSRRDTPYDFAARLEDLRSRFEKQWAIHVSYDITHLEPLVGAFLGQETFRLIHEAVTNAAKHGAASEVRVAVRTQGSEMVIEVKDNGTGFAFHGRMTLDQMRTSGSGPTVLAERVHALNGNLVVDSTDTGSVVLISVPLGWGGPADADNAHTG